ncbi:putative glycosyltransferase involved in capsule biosynthesis/tetratricopeptide (TPR) repeat protein [Shinella sp. BE166]|uniref:capsular polysaccharide export protein, LipB/KpsS family n=1 Tax=Shinella sp. BE166 TaxID=3373918 RepID=UPI003EBACB2E
MSHNSVITAVIPVRLSTDRLYDEPERIARIVATLPHGYVPLIVDYGTAGERAGELRDLAAATETKLVRVETGDQPFSVGHARDIGTQHAETPLILYHDIDFLLSPQSYERVLEETRLRGMPENAYTFFALPGVYLTEDFTRRYLDLFARGEAAFADTLAHDGVMRRDKSVYENHTYAISAIVASRYHLLAIGGHDKSFVGHGAEDFELLHRLASYAPRGPKTLNYYRNTMNNTIQRYEGFRAYFALYGIDVFQRGLQMAHLWHPRREDVSYLAPRHENQQRVSEVMADYDAGKSWVPPVEDIHSAERTLVLVKEEGTPAVRALRHAFPAFGRYEMRREGDFATPDVLLQTMDSQGFSRVFFLNPYGNAHRLSLYRGIKEGGRRFIVWDRGGLTDSWFFDPSGFLAESASYAPERWDKPLAEEDRAGILDWLIAQQDAETLEENGERIGGAVLRERLHLGDKKVVFAALQRPKDTATLHFAGPCGNAEGFNKWLAHLAATLDPADYAVLVKKHPLEVEAPDIPNVVFVNGDTHIQDLIEIAHTVTVINSGVGLIALGCGKPVVCCGDAYYAHPGLARTATSPAELVATVKEATAPDAEKRLRFFHYLVRNFYSFGKAKYVDRKNKSGGGSRLASRIHFSTLRGLTETPIELGMPPNRVTARAPLYYSYGGATAVKLASTPLKRIVETGKEARTRRDYEEAAALFAIARDRDPENLSFQREFLEIGVQRYGGVLEEMLSAPVQALNEKGEAAFSRGDVAEASRIFEMLHLREPHNPRHLRSLAECYLQDGAKARAIRCLDQALALKPGDKGISRRLMEIQRSWWQRLGRKEKPFIASRD